MARKVKLDMTGVESYTRCPEGTWSARVKKADMVEIQGSGDDGIKVQLEIISGKAKGSSVFDTFSLGEKALWKLKSFLEAIGLKANGKLMLDLDKIEGKVCEIDVIHDEYNGNKRAKVSAYNKPEDDLDDDEIEDEEEEQPKKPDKKTSVKSKKRPEPEDEEDDEDDEEEDEKPTSKKAKKAPSKPEKKSKKQPEPEEDDDDDWEDDDD